MEGSDCTVGSVQRMKQVLGPTVHSEVKAQAQSWTEMQHKQLAGEILEEILIL